MKTSTLPCERRSYCIIIYIMIGITAITLLALQFMQATAFSGVSKSVARPAISTSLFSDSNGNNITRKDAINTLAAAGMAASIYPSKVNAEEDGGKLIEFTVDNLDGEF